MFVSSVQVATCYELSKILCLIVVNLCSNKFFVVNLRVPDACAVSIVMLSVRSVPSKLSYSRSESSLYKTRVLRIDVCCSIILVETRNLQSYDVSLVVAKIKRFCCSLLQFNSHKTVLEAFDTVESNRRVIEHCSYLSCSSNEVDILCINILFLNRAWVKSVSSCSLTIVNINNRSAKNRNLTTCSRNNRSIVQYTELNSLDTANIEIRNERNAVQQFLNKNSKSIDVVVKTTLTADKVVQVVNLLLKSLLKLINACYSSIVRQRILKFSDSLLCCRNSLFDVLNVISLKLVGKILQVVSCRQSLNLILQIVNLLLIVSVSNLLLEILKSLLLSFEILCNSLSCDSSDVKAFKSLNSTLQVINCLLKLLEVASHGCDCSQSFLNALKSSVKTSNSFVYSINFCVQSSLLSSEVTFQSSNSCLECSYSSLISFLIDGSLELSLGIRDLSIKLASYTAQLV